MENIYQYIRPHIFKFELFGSERELRWYGLMYVLGFIIGSKILVYLSNRKFLKLDKKQIDNYVTYLIIGMLLGARTAYVFIYNWDYYSSNLFEALEVWNGGLSFHGAVFGMALATFLFAKKHNLPFFQVSDSLALTAGPGLFLGRLGNFFNGELYGRVTDSAVGIIFPGGGPYPRHASQLYEGIMEGLILGLVLWFLLTRVKRYGVISATFLGGYGFFRFIVEFFREPDAQLGYYFGGALTMGQILCFIMLLISFVFLYFSYRFDDRVTLK
jgi:phosphatidylglycerol:prolipoprotein diacylglycerol transferase